MLRVLILGVLISFAGCAELKNGRQPGPIPVKPPTEYVAPRVEVVSQTSRVIWKSKRAVWASYAGTIARSNYRVASAIEEDGLMTVNLGGDPMPYVDCGEIVATVKTTQGETASRFPGAVAYKRYQLTNGGKLYDVERRMALEARITLTFSAVDANRTRVDAKTAYSVTRSQIATTAKDKPIQLTDTVNFYTGEAGVFPNAATRCLATGKLESDLLALLK